MNRPTTTSESRDPGLEHPDDSETEWISSPDEQVERSKPHLLKRLRWTVLGIIIVLPIAAGIVWIKALQFKAMAAATAKQVIPPQPVNVAEVREEEWQPRVSAVGSVVAFQGTVVSAEAGGVVREIKF